MDNEVFYAGELIDAGGYQAFKPNKINHNFYFKDNRTLMLLEKASAALSKLNYLCLQEGVAPNVYINMLILLEALSSNKIEGTKTNVDGILSDKLEQKDPKTETYNLYKTTIDYLVGKYNEKIDISQIETIEKINKSLFIGISGKEKSIGKIRKNQNFVGGNDELSAHYVPPPSSMVKELLNDLSDFWNNKNLYIPDLIKIAIYHYQFETIHPFSDGNGRTGRIILNLQLKEKNLLKFPVLCLSDYWSKNRGLYYSALTTARFSHDLEYWIRFFLKSILDISEERINVITNIESLRKDYTREIKKITHSTQKYNELFGYLLDNPSITINKAKEVLQLSYQGTSKIIKNFVTIGILEKNMSKKRNRTFEFTKYKNILFKSLLKED